MSSENLWEMHVNVRHKQQQQQQQREHTTVATTTNCCCNNNSSNNSSYTIRCKLSKASKMLFTTNKRKYEKFLCTHTGNYLGTACCHFSCACNNIWPKATANCCGQKGTCYSLLARRATKNTLSAGKLNICLQSDKCKNSALIKFLRHNIVVLKAR